MARIPGIRRYLRAGRSDRALQRQVDDELAFHFDMCVDELVRHGMTPEQATREAERRFGDASLVRERLTRLDRERLGASPRDPLVFSIVAITLLAAAALASVVPAWRAARVDPLVALRDD